MSALLISRVWLDSEANNIAPLEIFAAAADTDFRCFWRSPTEDRTLVGVGVAAEWVGESSTRQEAATFVEELDYVGDTPILLGGFAFRASAQSADNLRAADSFWAGFPLGRLILPKVLLLLPSADEPAEAILAGKKSEKLLATLLSRAQLSEIVSADLATDLTTAIASQEHELDDSELDDSETGGEEAGYEEADDTAISDYRQLLHEAVEAVNSGELKKVVVARQVRNDYCPAPEDVISRLCERGDSSTVFAFTSANDKNTTASSVFAGASPELLAEKSGDCFSSLALAGSKPLHEADLLLSDPKEIAEHQYVVDHMHLRLEETGAELTPTDQPEVLRLANIAHLASRVSGKTPDSILELVEVLHPSPAVAGVPTNAALEFLDRHESFDRGWYAGPVGWLTPDGEGRFFVALRSILINPDECILFAGSGIVDGSCPEKEEQETWLKLQTAMETLLPPSSANSATSPATTSSLAVSSK